MGITTTERRRTRDEQITAVGWPSPTAYLEYAINLRKRINRERREQTHKSTWSGETYEKPWK